MWCKLLSSNVDEVFLVIYFIYFLTNTEILQLFSFDKDLNELKDINY
jgi:hypothetical protein